MLDRVRSFSHSRSSKPSSRAHTPQRASAYTTQRIPSAESVDSGTSDSSNSNPGSTARMVGKPPRSKSRSGGGSSSGGSVSSAIQRGRDTMGACTSSATTIRADTVDDLRLRSAAERFVTFRSKLRTLDGALREHHADLVQAERSRAALTDALADAGRGSPLHDLVGNIPDPTDETNSQDTNRVRSYAALQGDIASTVAPHLAQYREETLVYASEWEKTISTRIATELKHVRRLHATFVKYHRKVESLRNSADKKKGGPSDADVSKIERNESKLRTATKDYRRNLVAVTLLTEEVTDRGWKDLVPLVLMLIEHDVETSARTGELISEKMTAVREETKELGRRYEMDYAGMTTGRLRILLEEDATEFVSPEDMADIESIQPSLMSGMSATSAGTSNPGTYATRASSRLGSNAIAAAMPPPIQENPTAEAGSNVEPDSPVVATAPPTPVAEDDDVSLERPGLPHAEGPDAPIPQVPRQQREFLGPSSNPESSASPSASAPPAAPDLLNEAVSRGSDVARQEADERRRVLAAPPQVRVFQERGQLQQAGPGPFLPGHPKAASPSQKDFDDDGSKINYPTSIYFADANYNDDVTALTPYPDLVSI
mmetsp:Transcript_1217/g.3253  ORF Transcript_1217/g.3253 Transcript_1217/m.3253 type:complete len:601 (-) Transcript_1217:314-2116(-)